MKELEKVMSKCELVEYCNYNEDMCFSLDDYKQILIVIEFYSSPRTEYYLVSAYKKRYKDSQKRDDLYVRFMEIEYIPQTCSDNGYDTDEILEFAHKMVDAYLQ